MSAAPAEPTTPAGCIAFEGTRRIASGSLSEVAVAVKHALDRPDHGPVLVFDAFTGELRDLDTRGTEAEVAQRHAAPPAAPGTEAAPDAAAPRGRGRPRLGVVAREVTLLPRHWAWLAAQPGGASVALRKLVDEARHTHADRDAVRHAREAAYRFMAALAGSFPAFEEVTRALFAGDADRFARLTADWPEDVRSHAHALAAPSFRP